MTSTELLMPYSKALIRLVAAAMSRMGTAAVPGTVVTDKKTRMIGPSIPHPVSLLAMRLCYGRPICSTYIPSKPTDAWVHGSQHGDDSSQASNSSVEAILAMDESSDLGSDIEEAVADKKEKRKEAWKKGIPSLKSPFFETKTKGKELSFITHWAGNLSCHCKLHSSCKMPASTKYSHCPLQGHL